MSSWEGDEGLWTGADWYDETQQIGVSNGVPYSNDSTIQRRITAPLANTGSELNYKEATNVKLVESFLTCNEWVTFFPQANSIYTVTNLLRAMAKFPAFCNEVDDSLGLSQEDACKKELAAFLANVSHETSQLRQVVESICKDPESRACDWYDSQIYPFWPATEGEKYFGRGALQLSWNYNYGQFSTVAFNGGYDDKETLLNDPDEVATDGFLAFSSAMWFWMTPQSPKPSCHDVITGYFKPNQADLDLNITDGFGAVVNVINGGIECDTDDGDEDMASYDRQTYYKQYCEAFGVSPGDNLGCAKMGAFGDEGSSVYMQWW